MQTAALLLSKAEVNHSRSLSDLEALVQYVRTVMNSDQFGQVRILYLDQKYQLLEDEVRPRWVAHSSSGSEAVIRRGLEVRAVKIILASKHCGSDASLSNAELGMTVELANKAKSLSMTVADHIIITENDWLSCHREGWLPI